MDRSRSRTSLVAAVACGLALATAAPAALADAPPPACPIERLPLPGESDYSDVTAADPSGRWIAGRSTRGATTYAVVWRNGKPTELDLPYRYASPGGISRRGVVAGNATRDGVDLGFVYDHGDLIELALPAGQQFLTVTGISRRGAVSGWATTSDGSTARAYVWSLADPTRPTELPLPAGFATTVGSSPDGHVGVRVSSESGAVRSFVFDRRLRRTELHATMGNYDAAVSSIADGWVAGFEQSSVDAKTNFLRWNLTTLEPEIIPFDFYGVPVVNEYGVVGGAKQNEAGQTPVLYSDHIIDLARLANSLNARPTVVTRDGDAAGISEWPGSAVAVRWDCSANG